MHYENKYNNIVLECNKILNNKKSIYFFSNSIFSNQRFNSNFYNKFDYLICSNSFLLFKRFFKNFLKFILIFFKSFFIKRLVIKNKNQILFYSNCNKNMKDMYFSEIKEKLKNSNKKFSTIFLNIDFKNDSIIKDDIHLQVTPNFFTLIKIIQIILKSICIYFIEILKSNNSLKKKILFGAIINSFSWDTIYNLKLYFILLEIKKNKCCFFYPFEGYGHEKTINILFKNKKSFVIGYQHTILYKSTNLFSKIKKNYLPDVVLCTSKLYTRKFQNKFQKNVKLINIGKKLNKIKKKKKNNRILVIPEGDLNEVKYFISFLEKYLSSYKEICFTLRIHPVFKYDKESIFKIFNKFKKRIIISKKSFAKDVSTHQYTLYSGSSAVIDCIRNYNIPIYLNIHSKYDNNPLYEIKNKIFEVKSLEDLNKFLKYNKYKYRQNYPFIKRYVNQLFENLKKPQLDHLIGYLKDFN